MLSTICQQQEESTYTSYSAANDCAVWITFHTHAKTVHVVKSKKKRRLLRTQAHTLPSA